MIDTDKYEGHTPGPWEAKDVGFSAGESPWNDLDLSLEENQNLSGLPTEWVVIKGDFMSEADAQLIADAPDLLAEVKRLREENELLRQGIIDACSMASSGAIRPLTDGTIKHYFPLYLRELIE